MKTINLKEKFDSINQFWHPKQIAMVEDRQIVLIKMKGEFDGWFNHREDDKLLQVIKGTLEIHFKDSVEFIKEGELITIPKGTEYAPKAKEEVHLLAFERFEPLHD